MLWADCPNEIFEATSRQSFCLNSYKARVNRWALTPALSLSNRMTNVRPNSAQFLFERLQKIDEIPDLTGIQSKLRHPWMARR